VQGLVGLRGAIGPPGKRGPAGVRGLGERNNAIEALHDQIHDLYHEQDVQLRRIAQIQQQLDEVMLRLRRLKG
jgi:hypothetical protein